MNFKNSQSGGAPTLAHLEKHKRGTHIKNLVTFIELLFQSHNVCSVKRVNNCKPELAPVFCGVAVYDKF